MNGMVTPWSRTEDMYSPTDTGQHPLGHLMAAVCLHVSQLCPAMCWLDTMMV